MDTKLHGDPAVVWKLITKGICLTWIVLNRMVRELRSKLNDSNVVDLPLSVSRRMYSHVPLQSTNENSRLMKCCLNIISTVLAWLVHSGSQDLLLAKKLVKAAVEMEEAVMFDRGRDKF